MASVLSGRRSDKGDGEDKGDDEDGGQGQSDSSGQGGKKQKSDAGGGRVKNSHIIEEFIDVGVPHRVAYDQWTQYDDWSKIFKKESAKKGGGRQDGGGNGGEGDKDDDSKVTVTAKIGPSQRQWQTEIVEREPGRRIEWRSKGGAQAKGVVTFHRLDDRLTYLTVNIEYKPSGFMETLGNFFRMQRRRTRKDLKLFKNFVELRGQATGEGPGPVRGDGLRNDVDQQVESVKDKDKRRGGGDRGGKDEDGEQ
ncbi:MAG: hypothetical protein M3137_11075 [Actinomycetota bacterium]|nr:hypothetical protein [Actinomycetota bacterium]